MKISMKKRKIGYTYGSSSGVYSFRNEKSIQFESLLEKDFIQLMDFNDNVIDIIEQPITIEYTTIKGNKGTYTPDFLVLFKAPQYTNQNPIKPLLVEVKPTKKLKDNWDTLKIKFKNIITYSKLKDYQFKIFNENRIRSQKLKNIVFLHRFKEYTPNPDDINIIKNHLASIGHTTIEYIITHLFVTDLQKGNAIAHIWYLVYIKEISCDLSLKITNNTVIWLNTEEDNLGLNYEY